MFYFFPIRSSLPCCGWVRAGMCVCECVLVWAVSVCKCATQAGIELTYEETNRTSQGLNEVLLLWYSRGWPTTDLPSATTLNCDPSGEMPTISLLLHWPHPSLSLPLFWRWPQQRIILVPGLPLKEVEMVMVLRDWTGLASQQFWPLK